MITTAQARFLGAGILAGTAGAGVQAFRKRKQIRESTVKLRKRYEKLPAGYTVPVTAIGGAAGTAAMFGLTRIPALRRAGMIPMSGKHALILGSVGGAVGAGIQPGLRKLTQWQKENPKRYKVAKNVALGLVALELGHKAAVTGYGIKKGLEIARRVR